VREVKTVSVHGVASPYCVPGFDVTDD